MTRWTRAYDEFGNNWFYYEFRADGHATRHIELQGPERIPVAAAVRAEWEAALRAGTADEYYATFGATPDMPLHVWEGIDLEYIDAAGFEAAWLTARAACEAQARQNRTA